MLDRKPMQLRLPPEMKAWIKAQSQKNGSSQNSEVIRAVRDRMERIEDQAAT
ncbi:Arc family DNA-binding protein [Citreimonas salinaria]|uniref:Arc-like DNA binding domain-containing protein n=1 Tax=Citreimonas salinaria TaxID=321339 RepID=A0A1H3HTB1_9RHOB|nr:Arc family DNA-binding protein [Citreimonas salinaria]SDY18028.1 Arc-like DNA binding domain-containing protein [Citreimonas salinaria]